MITIVIPELASIVLLVFLYITMFFIVIGNALSIIGFFMKSRTARLQKKYIELRKQEKLHR